MSWDTLAKAAELAAAGRPFALVTVVWRRGPSSGKPGSTAVIHPDGSVVGWLGGACAEPTVVQAALDALRDGRPRLLVLGEADERPGVLVAPMACESEGALEVFVEPILPKPDLWVIGRSPATEALVAMAALLGWRTSLVDERSLDLGLVSERSLIVVATQGRYDEQALAAALATPAAYIGLVASPKRTSSVLEWLRGQGVNDDALVRVRAPAGLDLGATEHEEMAVAILAELVALRVSGAASPPVAVAEPVTAIDPVCGMIVDVVTSRLRLEREGTVWHFCSAGCAATFAGRSTTS